MDAEKARVKAEAKARRQKNLQARLGPRDDGKGSTRYFLLFNFLCSIDELNLSQVSGTLLASTLSI